MNEPAPNSSHWFIAILEYLGIGRPWTVKKTLVLIILVLVLVVAYTLSLWINERDGRIGKETEISQCRTEKENLLSDYQKASKDLSINGITPTQTTGALKNDTDFEREWDTSDFDRVEPWLYCPSTRGGNNYQRIVYKHPTSLISSDLFIKFQMINDRRKPNEYKQRFVVGIMLENSALAEYDIPTRYGGNRTINFRSIVPNPPGRTMDYEIKEGTIINLGYKTQHKHNQDITNILDISYIPDVEYADSKTNSFSNDVTTTDTNPETSRGNMFVLAGIARGGARKPAAELLFQR